MIVFNLARLRSRAKEQIGVIRWLADKRAKQEIIAPEYRPEKSGCLFISLLAQSERL